MKPSLHATDQEALDREGVYAGTPPLRSTLPFTSSMRLAATDVLAADIGCKRLR
jgi:hypothetical protein